MSSKKIKIWIFLLDLEHFQLEIYLKLHWKLVSKLEVKGKAKTQSYLV